MTKFPNINDAPELTIEDSAILVIIKRNEAMLKRQIAREKFLQAHKDYPKYLEELRLVRLKMEDEDLLAIQNEFTWRARGIEAISNAIVDARTHASDITGISFNLSFPNNPDVIRYCKKELFTAPTRFTVIGYDTAKFAQEKKLDPKDTKTIEQVIHNFNEAYCAFVDSACKTDTWGSIFRSGNEQYGHVWIELANSPQFIETASKYGYHQFSVKEE